MNDFRKVLDTEYYTYYTIESGDRVFMGNNEYYKKIMKKYKAF